MAVQDSDRRAYLARWIKYSRTSERLSVTAAAKHAGIDRRTWTAAEAGEPVQDFNLGAIEKVLDWPVSSALRVLAGELDWGEPGSPTATGPTSSRLLDEVIPVGTGVDPLDLSVLSPEDREHIRALYERLRRQRGE